eukprot:scaffold24397_cov18-Tisochrysis_lutea.AAC.1
MPLSLQPSAPLQGVAPLLSHLPRCVPPRLRCVRVSTSSLLDKVHEVVKNWLVGTRQRMGVRSATTELKHKHLHQGVLQHASSSICTSMRAWSTARTMPYSTSWSQYHFHFTSLSASSIFMRLNSSTLLLQQSIQA